MLVTVFREGHLYQQNPVPFVVYLMWDEAEMRAYCPAASEGTKTVFVPAEKSVYAHAGGVPLVDDGLSHGLMRDLSLAIVHDMFGGDYPPWLACGLSRMFADGELGAKPGEPKPGETPFDWFVGLPDFALWQRGLTPGKSLPSFEVVRTADAAQFAALGADGELVATAAVYLLKQLQQLRDLVWKMRPVAMPQRDPAAVLAAMRACVPRYDAYFSDPLPSLFKQRPDFRIYLECEQEADPAVAVSKSGANAQRNRTVGGYWWQYARLLLAQNKTPEAVEALKKSMKCVAHRERPAALRALADVLFAAKNWQELGPVVAQQHREILLPTPRMFLMLARTLQAEHPEVAARTAQRGLGLPAAGFEAEVEQLRLLALSADKPKVP